MHFSELSQPLKRLIFRRRFNIWQKSHLHNIMKEWRLLLDGRRISITFLLLLKPLRNHVLIIFLVSIKHSNDWKISAEDWGYNYCQQVHLPMSSNMYQYPKHFKIRVSQLWKCLLTDMFYHQHCINVDIYLNGPMHFYLGPIIILTKKLTLSYL